MAILFSQITILIIGVMITVLAAWGVFAPAKLVGWVKSVMDQHWGIYVAVIVRLILGAALIIAAPASPFPAVFQVLGAIAILAGVGLVVVGREQIRVFITWLFDHMSDLFIRLSLLFGIAFGGFLIYGVL